jgi:hypothetical protein
MARTAVAVFLAALALGALKWFVPFMADDRPVIAATPSLDGLFSREEVKVRRGQQACTKPVPLDPTVRRVSLVLHARGTTAAPLALELRGPGYVGRGRFVGYPAGGPVTAVAALDRPPPAAADGELCLRNEGRRAVGLVGTDEPVSLSLPATAVDGKPVGEIDPAITFLDGPPASLLDRFGTVLGRASDFTGGAMPLWLLWPLAVVFLLAVPAGVAVSVFAGLRRQQ